MDNENGFVNTMLRNVFWIELDGEHSHSGSRGFAFPADSVICTAIENYVGELGAGIEFCRKSKPIVFIIDSKEKFQAELQLTKARFSQRYRIQCFKID